MPQQLLPIYVYLVLLGWVFLDRAGMPMSAVPILIAAGALTATHQLRFTHAFILGLIGALAADTVWFVIGRSHGHRVLNLICRFSCEPGVCVRRTQDFFGLHPVASLMIAKFVPGLATLTSPVASQSGMRFRRFLLFDGMGSALWITILLATGRLLSDMVRREPSLFRWASEFSGVLFVFTVAAMLIWRFIRSRRAIRKLKATRVDPQELKRQLDTGEKIAVIDLRHPLELLVEPFVLPGAVHVSPEALSKRSHLIPRDREVVLYCTCPSEATSAKTAMALRRLGIDQVHTLRGGYDEWKRLGYPLKQIHPAKLSDL